MYYREDEPEDRPFSLIGAAFVFCLRCIFCLSYKNWTTGFLFSLVATCVLFVMAVEDRQFGGMFLQSTLVTMFVGLCRLFRGLEDLDI